MRAFLFRIGFWDITAIIHVLILVAYYNLSYDYKEQQVYYRYFYKEL